MTAPLCSIIIPCYNHAHYLPDALNSVLAQTYTDWEAIIVDDGSTDNTRAVAAQFTDPRIHYIYQENRGQTAALNRGLELVSGDYVTTLDADDWLTPASLLERVTCLEAHPELGAVYCDGYYCGSSGEILKRFSDNRSGNPTGDIYDALIISSVFGAGSPVMIRRAILHQHGLRYDESIVWCQDWDFYIRVSEWASFGYVDSPSVYYRLHESNMTLTMPEGRRLQSLIRTGRKVLDSARFTAVPLPQKRAFFYRFLVHDLTNRVQDQEEIINGAVFQSLPRPEQAQLLRWVATSYLLRGEQQNFVEKLLGSALRLAPLDAKALLTTVLSAVSFDLAATLTRFWHRKHQTTSQSPFELAKKRMQDKDNV